MKRLIPLSLASAALLLGAAACTAPAERAPSGGNTADAAPVEAPAAPAAPAAGGAVALASLPEVRYYLVADG